VQRTLDVGCAFGFFVEAQRELGIDAHGYDVSEFALDRAALGARGHVEYGNLLRRLPCKTGAFELVSAFETLEHVPPDVVPRAIAELRRVTSGYLIATIPSFGPNEYGPGGWFDVKVRPERLDHYKALGADYEGPVPYEDLYRDAAGRPVEGHLTIASFGWWTKRFAEAGFVRCGDVERAMHPYLERFDLTKYWNLYVLRTADAPVPPAIRSADEIADVEKRLALDRQAFLRHETGRRPVSRRKLREEAGVAGDEVIPAVMAGDVLAAVGAQLFAQRSVGDDPVDGRFELGIVGERQRAARAFGVIDRHRAPGVDQRGRADAPRLQQHDGERLVRRR
jgi:hypothetical protein